MKKFPPREPTVKFARELRIFTLTLKLYFRNIQVTSYGSSLLGLNSDTVCDLDVFDYFKFFQVKDDFCCYFALFSYSEDIFAAFSSILIRNFLMIWM